MKKPLKYLALPLAICAVQVINPPAPAIAQEQPQSGIAALEDFDYWKNLCQEQTAGDNATEALTACEQAIALRPNDESIWTQYSYTHLTLEQYPEAIAAINQVLTLNSDHSQALTYQCVAYLGLQQTEKALDVCNLAIDKNRFWDTQSPALAWRTRGQILHTMDQTNQALIAYDRALHLEPNDSPTLAYRCQTLVDIGEYGHGLTACEAALDSNGTWHTENPALAWAYKGKALSHLGADDKAIAAYDQAVTLDPTNPEYLLQQGRLLEQTENYLAASLAYTQAVELVPNSSRGLLGQCNTLNKQAQYEPAKAACEQAIAGNGDWWEPGVTEAWYRMGQAIAGLGDYEAALTAIDRALTIQENSAIESQEGALAIQPTYLAAQSDRSVILWYSGEAARAIQAAQSITSANSAPTAMSLENRIIVANTWANLGRIYSSLSNHERSANAYEQSIQFYEQSPDVWADLSAALWKTEQYARARETAEIAIDLEASSEQAWQNQGAAQAALGEYANAVTSYRQVLALNSQNAQAWANLGVLQLTIGNAEEARKSLERAIQLDPNQALAQRALARLDEA